MSIVAPMKFQFEIGNRLRTVEVQREGSHYVVKVDGRSRLVEAARVDGDVLSLIVRDDVRSAPTSIEAAIDKRPRNGAVDVHINGYRIAVHLCEGRRSNVDKPASPAGAAQRVAAPMPGKVVRVPVKPGEVVQPRQVLVVVEAMKMENELRAAREGKVASVLVKEGQSVEAGAVLVIVGSDSGSA